MSPKIFEKVQKKLGEQDVLLAPPVILLGEHLLPLLPLFPRLWLMCFYRAFSVEETSHSSVSVVARENEAWLGLGAGSLAHSGIHCQQIVVGVGRNVVFQRSSTPLHRKHPRMLASIILMRGTQDKSVFLSLFTENEAKNYFKCTVEKASVLQRLEL